MERGRLSVDRVALPWYIIVIEAIAAIVVIVVVVVSARDHCEGHKETREKGKRRRHDEGGCLLLSDFEGKRCCLVFTRV